MTVSTDWLERFGKAFGVDPVSLFDDPGQEHAQVVGVIRANGDVTAPTSFFADEHIPRARLRLAPEGAWVVERYPVDVVTPLPDPPGWTEVTLPVASERWLARLLVRLGPHAELLAVSPGVKVSRMLELCGDRFVMDGSLKEHMLLHTGEKPQVCSECGARFTHASTLRKHKLTHKHL